MNPDILFFFNDHMDALPMYKTLERLICEEVPDLKIKASKTKFTFSKVPGMTCSMRRLPVLRKRHDRSLSTGCGRWNKEPRYEV